MAAENIQIKLLIYFYNISQYYYFLLYFCTNKYRLALKSIKKSYWNQTFQFFQSVSLCTHVAIMW